MKQAVSLIVTVIATVSASTIASLKSMHSRVPYS